ncbi:MAG TPA: hypothetical protein VK735_42680 [Pseudonocardia sp.]|jgi:hypothetical protein|uniref:hypothetical protein n=1 Tax=Pseudonocardia sp. TaxID=60912 RepID=UPI002BB98595|nr:hypothetical protein [Pseudonocardia sp.]HTF54194.1 hypothetical protein [Pseudonocardia sp.]
MSKFNVLGIIPAVLLSAVVVLPIGLVTVLLTAVPAAATRLRRPAPGRPGPRLRPVSGGARNLGQLGAKWSQPAVPS